MDIIAEVKEYYGKTLATKDDLKTSACCTAEVLPEFVKPYASKLHPEVVSRFYGCGSPLPPGLNDCTVLDLGCGTGRDVFLIAPLVGNKGKVIGVDMTDEQLAVARKHTDHHMQAYGLNNNVDFRQGYIEDLAGADIADNSVDVVVSNCVLNLSPKKDRVFSEIWRVLKPGGELYFSDVFATRRLSEEAKNDPVMVGECLGGALYTEDFRRMMAEIGFNDPRTVSSAEIELSDKRLVGLAAGARFFSNTVRAFKLPLEDRCEDYGQVATYKGTLAESPLAFALDDHHLFERGRPMLVCGNTADMVQSTRYRQHFEVRGDKSVHFGLFDCGPVSAAAANTGASDDTNSSAGCC